MDKTATKSLVERIAILTGLVVLTIVVIFFGITAIRFLWFRPVQISGESMAPTLQDEELRYVNTLAKPTVGDIVVFYYAPTVGDTLPSAEYYGANAFWRSMPIWGLKIKATYAQDYEMYVKRVVGLPGDEVELRAETVDGVARIFLYRNDAKVDENIVMINANSLDMLTNAFVQQYTREHGQDSIHYVKPTAPFTVPEGCYYVLGDNRDHSTDSRSFGAVNAALFVGTVR